MQVEGEGAGEICCTRAVADENHRVRRTAREFCRGQDGIGGRFRLGAEDGENLLADDTVSCMHVLPILPLLSPELIHPFILPLLT
mgnify:CR=1 FL=1